MASSFCHSLDQFLRVGDAVRSRQDRERSSLDVSLVRDTTSRNSHRPDSSLSDAPQAPATEHLTMEGMWKAATRGTWISQTEVEPIAGTIKSIDVHSKTAEVIVWKRGAKCTAGEKRRPVERFPLKSLIKMDPHHFDITVKKEFMKDATYHLRLHNEGFDESAPYALMAYNNKIISQLMGKIDTSAKMSLKDLRRKRPTGPREMMRSPIPPMPVEVVDPLHAARAELQAIQSVGIQKARSRSALSGKASESEAALLERRVCSRGLHSPPVSIVEGAVFQERRATSNRIAGVMLEGLRDRGSSASIAPSSLLPSVGNGTKAFISALEEPDDARKIHGTIMNCRRDGIFTIRQRSDSRLFDCSLADILLWPSEQTYAKLAQLVSLEVDVVPVARGSGGAMEVRMYLRGEKVQEELLRSGLASVVVRGAGMDDEKAARLTAQQQSAMTRRVGMWSESANVADQTTFDGAVREGDRLPPLFDVFDFCVQMSTAQRGGDGVE
jgi:hypothetical protein